MRIFYDHQVFSLQDAGGASRYHYELIRKLQTFSNLQIQLLIGLNNSVMPFAALARHRTRVIGFPTSIRSGIVRYTTNELLSSLVGPLQGRFDIYHPTLYRVLPWVRRKRVVVTHHDCTHERFPHLFKNAASIIAVKRKLFAQAEAILCVSASSQRDLLHFYPIDKNKTRVVHHGFSPLELPPVPTPDAVTARPPYVLYVGSRFSYKNFTLLLDAFSKSGLSTDYRLLVVGGGDWTAKEQAKIKALHLGAHISLIPNATDAILASAYHNAALLVYPSLYEGFGFPPLEAMSQGCPVLVNRTSSLPEICGEAAFYFEGQSEDALALALVSILSDTKNLEAKRRVGVEQVKSYDWGRSARDTLSVYREVLSG